MTNDEKRIGTKILYNFFINNHPKLKTLLIIELKSLIIKENKKKIIVAQNLNLLLFLL
jgi:hypothetical protein